MKVMNLILSLIVAIWDAALLNFSLAPVKFGVVKSTIQFSYGPAKVFALPVATLVQPVTLSPTLPQPLPLIKTVVDPV